MVSEGFIMEEKVMWNNQMLTSQEIRNRRRQDPGQVTTPKGLPFMPYLQQPNSDSSRFHHLSK